MTYRYKTLIGGIWALSLLLLPSCNSSGKTDSYDSASPKNIDTDTVISHKKVTIFGVETENEESAVIKSLADEGIIGIDSLSIENGQFQFAIVDVAGVKFGMNKGFSFITSRQDKDAVNALVSMISKYYGTPEVDGDKENPEWCYYHWNLYNKVANAPYIRIRPLHSKDGGLTMMWEF